MMWRSMGWLLILVIGALGLWASPQTPEDELRARVEALEKRVRELEQRLARIERRQPFPQSLIVVPPIFFGLPRAERQMPSFGTPRPAPIPFVQPYYYPLVPESPRSAPIPFAQPYYYPLVPE